MQRYGIFLICAIVGREYFPVCLPALHAGEEEQDCDDPVLDGAVAVATAGGKHE